MNIIRVIKAFLTEGTSRQVTIQWKNGKPLFLSSDIGAILGIKQIRTSMKNFDDDEKVLDIMDGQETVFLTTDGLLRLIMSSRKPIARPLQKWIPKFITNIREIERCEIYEKQIEEEETKLLFARFEAYEIKTHIAQTQHNSLIQTFKGPNRKVVFFGKIQDDADEETSLIKIGSTQNIETLENITMIHVFDCPMNEAYEKFLHTHSHMVGLKCDDGVFKMTEEQCEKSLRIAKCNLHKFASSTSAEQMLNMQQFKLEQKREKQEENNEPDEDYKNETVNDDEVDPILLYADNRRYTQARGDKVQCYSPDGKTLLNTYEGHTDAIRKLSIEDPSALRIKAAIVNKTVYRGFRWASLKRTLPDDTFQDIGETKESIEVRKGLVAMLNLAKTRIEKVYCDQKAAGIDRQLKSVGAISSAMKLQRKCQGHYFVMWNDCSKELQDEYLSRESLPEKRVSSTCRPVEKVHPITGKVLQKYGSVSDVLNDMCIARLSLQNAAEFGYIVKGYKWRYC